MISMRILCAVFPVCRFVRDKRVKTAGAHQGVGGIT